MKRFLYGMVVVLMAAMNVSVMQANDYLEQDKHYTVQSMGNGVLRFYVPIWVYGTVNDYYLEGNNNFSSNDDSYIWYSTNPGVGRGDGSVHRIASVSAVRYGKNDENGSEGQGYIYIHEGSAIIQSTYNGEPIVLQAGDGTYWNQWKTKMSLKRKSDDDHERITYFIFDWYPPTSLQNTDFYWGVSANIYKKSSGESCYKKWWAKPDKFHGNSTPQSPELFQPYFYALDETGATGYGCAAIQFAVYQEPVSYHTSLNSQEVNLSDRSGTIVVPTKDSVQRFFSGYFKVKVDDGGNEQVLQSNEVHIPAYHRIYDLSGTEMLDEKNSVTGEIDLSWTMRYPSAQDLVPGDVFEVQRATKEDFSDAETIETVAFKKDSSIYHVKDNPLMALGADTSEMASEQKSLSVTRKVVSKDKDGNPYAEYEVKLSSSKVMNPGRNIYYRVRRASSSIWGWNHEFAQSTDVISNDYLAPLAENQADYTLDPNFSTNRKVHFNFKLDNQTVTPVTEPEADCKYTEKITRLDVKEYPVRIQAIRDMSSVGALTPSDFLFYLEITKNGVVEEKALPITKYYTYYNATFPADAKKVRLVVKERTKGKVLAANEASLTLPYVKTAILYFRPGEQKVSFDYEQSEFNRLKDSVENAHPLNHDSVRHELYIELQQKISDKGKDGNPRCQWDKNALLYLRRELVETGETVEYVVPQDSIIRNADGSWSAHMTDIADRACVHYKYSVRLDQTNSLLKVINQDQLNPKAIQGPDLFYNEVAKITRFNGSDGSDRYSILLTWEPTPGGLDDYILKRREKGSTAAFDSLITTIETDYRDREVEPGTVYEYELTSRYTCHGTTTTNSATTTGRRSPYGLISGRIAYSDGSGCPGIEVGLEGEGVNGLKAVTDEFGNYTFDSLLYGAGTEYSVIPTSESAEFRFNNTSATTASVRLSADNPVAEGIAFANISSVRCTGRVLYSKSTIPVREANILLNGQEVKTAGGNLHTDVSGNFELQVPKGTAFTLQIAKAGHTFEGDGFVVMNDSRQLTITEPLDGVRVWDNTKVRLAGRVVGGKIQAEKPLGFGLSENNLGDDLQLVLELEGDNISHIVRDENDLTRDTFEYTVEHEIKGATHVHYQKKRIIINPDPETGEFFADLFPVRYKITQATARGYATLFAQGKTSETLELSDAAKMQDSVVNGSQTVHFNTRYDLTYRSPISISCIQMRYGLPLDFYGEQSMARQNILNQEIEVPLVSKDSLGENHYLFGAPVFSTGNYRFRITAHEDYYYNNEPKGKHEEVRIDGGALKVYNGLHDDKYTQIITTELNWEGQADVTLPVDYVSFLKTGEEALRVLDLSVETDGQYVESQAFKAYITGNKGKGRNFLTTIDAGVNLLDILRDPPGSASYAYIEKGTTYKYNYTWSFTGKFGVELGAKYGTGNEVNFGTYLGAVAGGIYSGYTVNTSVANTFALPISSQVDYKRSSSYTFTTSERIETGNDSWFVGSRGDVYIGSTQSAYFGLTDAVKPLDSVTYASLQARLQENAGNSASIQTVAEGRDLKGNKYYLAIGEETEVGTAVSGTFAYTQDYIVNTMLPKLIRERDALLVTGDSMTVQKIADARNEVVYWSKVPEDAEAYALTSYVKLFPKGDSKKWVDVDDVALYNKQILNWINLIKQNEREKLTLMSGVNADLVGNYSVSSGVKTSYSESYDYSTTIAYRWDFPGGALSGNFMTNFSKLISGAPAAVAQKLASLVNLVPNEQTGRIDQEAKDPLEIDGTVPGAKWSFTIKPILDINFDRDPSETKDHKKTAGFVLQSDGYSSMNVSVMRLREEKNEFNTGSAETRDFVDNGNDYDGKSYQYGSFVYVLNGGATKCPWEGPEESVFYEVGGKPAVISHGTARLENPKIDMTVHERSDVPHDKPAIFNVRISNEVEDDISGNAGPVYFNLKVDEGTNQKGAKILMDGMPLYGAAREIKILPGQIINKTIEVYAGEDYDYEDIVLGLYSICDVLTYSKASFSVHYMPVSCEVNIATPHDKWVMNTFSPRDSAGYYMPVVIDGFDVNYKNFDHIEFQYKLSKQSEDGWVNMCSYYADSIYYNKASGSKAMIKGGRIENIRFYGERDPMEQEYDLRAVSFCRHGNSYITRPSAVLTGIKDTRAPIVFGEPEPANSILGVGDNLKLRFNEAIAGNYLDEDNNFQITGITNATGLGSSTALHFDGKSVAYTKAKRDLFNKDYTIDMMIRPTQASGRTENMILFETSNGQVTKQLILTPENRLRMLNIVGKTMLGRSSQPIDDLSEFRRILLVADKDNNKIRFYAGNKDITAMMFGDESNDITAAESGAKFTFGSTYDGDMLEARVWTKALTPEEISATADHSLTGYERELLAYYRMDEGKGETVTDYAHGATLYLNGCSWNKQKGYSLRLDGDSVQLAGNLLGRSAVYDETIMFWFKAETSGTLFRADQQIWSVPEGYADNSWHHWVLTVSRMYNNVALFLDGKMIDSYDATEQAGIEGAMWLGGNGFKGNIDEFAVFEQALPKPLVDLYGTVALTGDEMGLMGYLPFEEQYTNPSSIIELRFSINDKRIFRDPTTHKEIDKVVPLLTTNDQQPITNMADKANNAPVKAHGLLKKLHFNWAFNNDELMINILNNDYEVNKQSIYITVRDVEDMNGNPMSSPVTWTAFVDRNNLKWSAKKVMVKIDDHITENPNFQVDIVNYSGKRHTYTIESLPAWLSVDATYGAVDPMGQQAVNLVFNSQISVGEYSDILYVTDENGLSEPLPVEYTVEAIPPYDELHEGDYPYNMSVCAKVEVNTDGDITFDTDSRDIVYAMYHNECVGMAHVTVNTAGNTSDVYLSVLGKEEMNRKQISFQLWQASTGKIFGLTPNMDVLFSHGFVYGCDSKEPLILSSNGSERQQIELKTGWNWASVNLNMHGTGDRLATCMTAAQPWTNGDIIKNPNTREFSTYDEENDAFAGTLERLHYSQMYMIYTAQGNTMRITGDILPDDSMKISVRGDGQWTPMPCLLDRRVSVTEVLADYYQNATPGDLIKAHNRFATFTDDKRWVGDLTALQPGEGYLFRRMGLGTVEIAFHRQNVSKVQTNSAPKRVTGYGLQVTGNVFSNPNAATNMTMIARVDGLQVTGYGLRVFVGDELAAVAEPITITNEQLPMSNQSPLYFLTIQSDRVGKLRFEMNGQWLNVQINEPMVYVPDSHHGSLKAPVVLIPVTANPSPVTDVFKIVEDDHVVIIRNGEKYDVTGKKL